MNPDELAAWLRLVMTPGVGRSQARALLSTFGSPDAVFRQSPGTLRAVVAPAQAQALSVPPDGWRDRVALSLRGRGDAPAGVERRIVPLGDAHYPAELLSIEDPPLLLHLQGQISLWRAARAGGMLAIVGSRNPTPQGALDARAFARDFSARGIAVVSGLALGVDGAAHEGALAAAGVADAGGFATVAVVGTGLDIDYPPRHAPLARRIAERGLVLSEMPLGTPPVSSNFPQRNRLISALSRGTLVVEATLRSGSLITARMANEQGRDVFALPGSIHSPQSRGCHWLIRQGAKLVESANDVLEELPGLGIPGAAPLDASHVPADEESADTDDADADAPQMPDARDADGLLAHLGFGPASLDALAARTGLALSVLQARLLDLELEGHVARLPGGVFQRLDRG